MSVFKKCADNAASKAGTQVSAQGLAEFAEASAQSLAGFTPHCPCYRASDLLGRTLFGIRRHLFLFLLLFGCKLLCPGLLFGRKLGRLCLLGFRSLLNAAPLQKFISRIGVIGLGIFRIKNTTLNALFSLQIGDRPHPALRRKDITLFDNCGNTVIAQ